MGRIRWYLLVVVGLALPGCESPFLGRPNWCNPGTASQQMAQARKFDPFPDPTIGPPILGGRPMGFMEPRAEPDLVKHQFVPGASALPYAQAY